ncbi:tetratricopeptide (TPR) repeat protein [Streptomyces sp. SAI-133]|uniref:FxSxx-COOH system tetratricopeptide repeat protein n=1 Tax=unclassified Streptomyces TaxID=2593676 RepID=UPI0024735F81|nr:FxSxx-COOH system tetratricopeptide repeat protein [Streptomyces sp. SAI-133]MDH6589942.1 tetratricopeptide (TPR) repeat protein [Streptomyces sp. SAI-133]
MLARLLLAPVAAAVAGGIVWAVAHFGLDKADQTSSVVGGVVGLIGLLLSLYALRTPASTAGHGGNASGTGGQWVSTAASLASYRAPIPQVPVRGRDDEIAVLARLVSSKKGGLAVVCGTGGLGKTTLAAQTARQAEAAGRVMFWVRWQDDPSRLAQDLTRIAQTLGLSESRLQEAQSGLTVLVDVVWGHLATVRGWVIVVDNVDTPRRIGPGNEPLAAYRGWLRPDGAGLLLVTSRDVSPATWGPRAHLIHLQPLTPSAAGTVLHDSAPTAGSLEEAAALGTRLGGLPLALSAASQYLVSPTSRYSTFAAYHQALEREFVDLIGAEHPQATDPEVARTVVRHTFDLSLNQLHSDGYTLARPLLYLLALLEAAPIPLSLITPALLSDVTARTITAAELDAALAGLHQYGLIATPAAPASGMSALNSVGQVVLHPLVRDVMALTPPGTDQRACYTALDAHLIRAVRDTCEAERAGWPTARLLTPHLPPVLYRATDTDFTTARDALDLLADTLSDAGAAAEEHLLREHVLAAESARLGLDHPDVLTSRRNLANALDNLGRYQEAADLHHQVLAERERILGPDHPQTLTSRDNLADSLRNLGRYQEAANLHQQGAADSERILGPDHPQTLTSRGNLANALNDLGRYQEAAVLQRQVLADSERILGPDHPDTFTSRGNLADSLNALGHNQEAAVLQRQVLAHSERILGPHHPRTLASRNNLAGTLSNLGHHQEAADHQRQVLSDYERTLGPDHPNTLTSRGNLASALNALGRYQEAIDLHQQVLAERERILGPDHPDTLTSRGNLADSLSNLGRYQEAANLHQQGAADSERILGPDHPDTLTSRGSLADALNALGRYQEAIDLHQQVLAARERILGPDHPYTLASQSHLAETQARAARSRDRRWTWRRAR